MAVKGFATLAYALLFASPAQCQQSSQASPASASLVKSPGTFDELKTILHSRYDGKTVAAMVGGLYAGEQEKAFIGLGKGKSALMWNHYHESVEIPKRVPTSTTDFIGKKPSDLHQLDDRTFGGLAQGLNVSQIEKGDPLKVTKFYVYDRYIEFVLATTRLGHNRDIDMQRAQTRTTTTVGGGRVQQRVEVAGFGMVFRFYFDKEGVLKAANVPVITNEIDKYLMPKQEAEAAAEAAKNVEIDVGLSEEEVVKRLGQPLKSIRVGNEKTLKYNDMTVILKDGKVSDVKID